MQAMGIIIQILAGAALVDAPTLDLRVANAVEGRTPVARVAPRPRAAAPCANRSMLMTAPCRGIARFMPVAALDANRAPRRVPRCFYLISS